MFVFMFFIRLRPGIAFLLVSMQIGHIMIMVFIGFIQQHSKITTADPGFAYPADLCCKAFLGNTVQDLL